MVSSLLLFMAALGKMDLHAMPGVVHVAFEVPKLSHVLGWVCLDASHARTIIWQSPGERANVISKSTRHKDQRARRCPLSSGLSSIDREFDPLNGSSFTSYCIALDTSWSCRYYLTFLRRSDNSIEYQIFYGFSATPIDLFSL